MPRCLAEEYGKRVNKGLGRGIDPELTGTGDNWAASVDHVIPRSQGGRTIMENLRAAHRKCNSNAAGKPLRELVGKPEPSGNSRRIIQEPAAVLGGRLPWPEPAVAPARDPRKERMDTEWAEHVREARWGDLHDSGDTRDDAAERLLPALRPAHLQA